MEGKQYAKAMFPIISNNSLYGLGMDYISYCFGNKITDEEKDHILQSFAFLLNNGWCIDDIYLKMNNIITSNYDKITDIDFVVNYINGCAIPKRNLLHISDYRAHSELRLYSSNPIITDIFDWTTFENVQYEYYNEPIASYSFDSFMKYINKQKFNMLCSYEKLRGGFNYIMNQLIENYTQGQAINILLYAYDEATKAYGTKKLKDAFTVSDYLDMGLDKYNRTVNKIVTGEIEFKYKERLLFDRSGMVD